MADFFKKLLDEHKKQVEAGGRSLLIDEADRVIAQAKRLTPVDTGHLRNSFFRSEVSFRDGVGSIEVINNVKYAVPIEKGHTTRNRKAWVEGFWMLESAIKMAMVGFAERVGKIIKPLGTR